MQRLLAACLLIILHPSSAIPAGSKLDAERTTLNARGCRFVDLRDLSRFTASDGEQDGEIVLTSPEIDTGIQWDELIVSWNADTPSDTGLEIEARAIYPDRQTKWYGLGLWSSEPAKYPRESVVNQKDADGDVKTDTLVIARPASKARIRVTLYGPPERDENVHPRLNFLGICLLDSKANPPGLEPNRAAWGREMDVPERSQLSYPGGSGWCSPTSTSMVLAYWAKTRQRPEWDRDVPEVARCVYDKNWPGTGNWPFNTAYAGSLPGIRAYITRFTDVSEIEDWVDAGVPVILSVLPRLLTGSDSKSTGHLIVCVGFTREGDAIVNDPWARMEKGQKVRRTYTRKNLAAAWAASRNTVYLIYPESLRIPNDRFGHWATGISHGPAAQTRDGR